MPPEHTLSSLFHRLRGIALLEQKARSLEAEIERRREAESLLEATLKEKEMLLKEMHHRVKNNLQIISSLLRLQSAKIQDLQTNEVLGESQDRVRAMAQIVTFYFS